MAVYSLTHLCMRVCLVKENKQGGGAAVGEFNDLAVDFREKNPSLICSEIILSQWILPLWRFCRGPVSMLFKHLKT